MWIKAEGATYNITEQEVHLLTGEVICMVMLVNCFDTPTNEDNRLSTNLISRELYRVT